ncbi:4'-phosphopantetheinyl transferase family protein [Streptomyces sp. NPDC056347]|uniref:4'-phosphopantetheinyl transferase family protein n=1 Tax=Streptomyces sp. NPDC056347 TaxID=3345790 RepID=UPI0035DF8EEA
MTPRRNTATSEVRIPEPALEAVDRIRETGETHIWWWPLGTRTDPADYAVLDDVERGRAQRFHAEADAAAFTATRANARRAVARLLGIDPAHVAFGRRVCPGCGDREHGPPAVSHPPVPLAVSLSRTAGAGTLALRAGTWVGVDVEALRPVEPATLADVVLTATESAHVLGLPPGPARDAAFHRAWTRKEAVVKAVGLGLLGMPLNTLDVHPDQDGPVRVTHRYREEETHWQVTDLTLGDRWAASVARPDTGPHGPVHLHAPA